MVDTDDYIVTVARNFEKLRGMTAVIDAAAAICVESLRAGGKVMFCGNGGSAADSQHFAAELMGRFLTDRRPLAALALTVDTSALTAIGNDYGYDEVFARQLRGIGRPGDVLVGISTSGGSRNVCRAFETAQKLGINTIALTGEAEGAIGHLAKSRYPRALASNKSHSGNAHCRRPHYLRPRGEQALLRQAVILVGGLGTRLGALSAGVAKPMLPIAGEPFLDILLRNVARYGFAEIILLAGHNANAIRDHYSSGRIGDAEVRVIEESRKAGTGGALREAAADLDDIFLLSNGDLLFDFNYLALAQQFFNRSMTIAIALREVSDPGRYGQVEMDDAGRVVRFAEKQVGGKSGIINGGLYVASRRILDRMGPGEVSLERDILPILAEVGEVFGVLFKGHFIDIGLPESYAQAQHELREFDRRKVVFFDRDGTLTRDDGYTYRVEDLEWLPGAPEAIRRCNDAGRLAIVVTNQSGIAHGRYDLAQMKVFHKEMNRRLQEYGAHLDAFYHCPHHPQGTVARFATACKCRKPGIGLFEQAAAEWRLDLTGAIMIGDKQSDVDAAEAFGIGGLVTNGENLVELVSRLDL